MASSRHMMERDRRKQLAPEIEAATVASAIELWYDPVLRLVRMTVDPDTEYLVSLMRGAP